MLEIIKAIIYGIVEGITEWLPISSTGHLILVEKWLPFKGVSKDFFDMFDVVIQLGAIMAVVVLFWKKIWPFALTKKEQEENEGSLPWVKMDIMTMWFKIMVACIPAILIVIFDKDDTLERLFYNPVCISIALIVFGIAFIVIESWNKGRKPRVISMAELSFLAAIVIGFFQMIAAIFPGTSRSGATIVGALLIGVSRKVAAEFTFFMAIPVMAGASLLKIVKFGFNYSGLEIAILLTGVVVSFLISLFILRFLMNYIKKHDFTVFGWYRIALGIIVLAYYAIFELN